MLKSGNVSTLHLYKHDRTHGDLSEISSASPRRY